VRKADNLTTILVLLSWNLGTLTSWNPLGHSRPVKGLPTCTRYGHRHRVTVTRDCIDTICLSWWWARCARNIQRVKNKNKYIEKNCASRWSFTKNHYMMHGQQNVKFRLVVWALFRPLFKMDTAAGSRGLLVRFITSFSSCAFLVGLCLPWRRVKFADTSSQCACAAVKLSIIFQSYCGNNTASRRCYCKGCRQTLSSSRLFQCIFSRISAKLVRIKILLAAPVSTWCFNFHASRYDVVWAG
jgi:hypothetical protein